MSICAITSVCEEDAGWVDQYLAEVERLRIPFFVHFDRCTDELKQRMMSHPRSRLFSEQNNPAVEFTEKSKQVILALAEINRYDWALAWDIDETFEADALQKMQQLAETDADQITCTWINLWEDQHHVRVDGVFQPSLRVKLYRLGKFPWVFDHPITNGAKPADGHIPKTVRIDLTCLHHGMMTRELRLMHKERWDRIYSTALRGDPNPYGFWREACDESILPVVVKHGYFS